MSEMWPLEDLVVRTPRLELRWPGHAELTALAELAAAGIHDPDWMPFSLPWTDVPPVERGRSVLQWHWRNAGALTPESWSLNLVTVVDGAVVGTQALGADRFAVLREADTGSWLGRRYQGRGIGTEMRSAVVHLAFEGLGADYVTSGAYADNLPSHGVSRKLGYVEDGLLRVTRRDTADVIVRLRLSREEWEKRRRDDIEIRGLVPCLPLLGVSD
jgi:RimJ/RimL family protein N-acetyltransferase